MAAAKRVDFYFDSLSPFSDFASLSLPALCRERNAELAYHPVLFAGLLDHWGHLGPAEIPPKAFDTFKMCVRHAALHGIPFRGPLASCRTTSRARRPGSGSSKAPWLSMVDWTCS